MLKLSLVSKYFILIFLSFFIINASLAEDKKHIQKEEIILGETEVDKAKADLEAKDEAEEAPTEAEAEAPAEAEEVVPEAPAEAEAEAPAEAEAEAQAEVEAEAPAENISNSNNFIDWIIYIIIFLVMMTVIALVIYTLFDVKFNNGLSFNLTRKKSIKRESKAEKPIFNEASKEKAPEIKIPSSDMEGHIAQQSQNINELKKDLANLLKNIDDMNQTFLTLRNNLDQKDEELARYKEGYDATIFKNFLLRFTRVDKVIKEYMALKTIDLDGLKDIQIQMDDALAECEVEMFSPEIGSNFKTSIGVADNPDIKETSNESLDSTIAEVLKPGYRRKLPIKSTENYQIITKAKVVIYVYKKLQK